jgi:large subunit ribosomal protein L19e
MKLDTQKRLAAGILKCTHKRVVFDNTKLSDIKAAITRADIRGLINKKIIRAVNPQGKSMGRSRKALKQKRKGRGKGHGKREGTHRARLPKKIAWMNKIRSQRRMLRMLREKEILSKSDYRQLYLKANSGFFRSVRHIKLYIEEHKLAQNGKSKTSTIQKKKTR